VAISQDRRPVTTEEGVEAMSESGQRRGWGDDPRQRRGWR
jgi:hypothetical protein